MTDSPCYLTITRLEIAGQTPVIRIEAGDKVRPIVRLDMEASSFSQAIFGDQVIAAISTGKTP